MPESASTHKTTKSAWLRGGITLLVVLGAVVSVAIYLEAESGGNRATPTVETVPVQVADRFPVQVIGRDFSWTFRYPGPDGLLQTDDDVVSERLLHLPPGKLVQFDITSDDYVYVFGIPRSSRTSFGTGKSSGIVEDNGSTTDQRKTTSNQSQKLLRINSQDKRRQLAVPEIHHSMEFETGPERILELTVDPMCGFRLLHDPLMGEIVVTSAEDFSRLLPPKHPAESSSKLGDPDPNTAE